MSANISGLGQISQSATDLDRATAFYRDVLGLPHLFTAPPGLAFFMIGATRLMISLPEGDGPTKGSVLYLTVPDIDAAINAVRGSTKVTDEPHMIAKMPDHELWMAFFEDSEGNILGFMEERR